MQRQSLGSPAAKHPPPAQNAGGDDDDGKKKRKKKAGVTAGVIELEEAGEDGTATTPERPFRRVLAVGAGVPTAERSIHLIPVLTLLCFLVLYLCSHDLSSSDMADLGVAGRLSDHTVSRAGIGGEVSAAAATRSHRSLKELDRLPGQHQSSRKLGRRTAA